MTEVSGRRRVWFITGTSSGMGHAAARAALEHGDCVAATARDTRPAEGLVAEFPDQALALRLDVRDTEAARVAVTAAVRRFHAIDVVFSNACYALAGPVEGISDRQARDLFDTGFFGALNVLRAVLPVMRSQRSGHVLQMSSIFGHMAFPAMGMLAAVKQALGGATQAMSAELAPLGIHVTQIEPGGLATGFMAKMMLAEQAIDDYDGTAGPSLRSLSELPAAAVADPGRVAAALLELVEAGKPPARLAVGGWAQAIIGAELAATWTNGPP